MPFSTIDVQGLVTLPTGDPASNYRLKFVLDRADKDSALVVPHESYYTIPEGGIINVPLWPNARGMAGTVYKVYLIEPGEADANRPMGTLTVPDVPGPINLYDYFDVAPPPTLSEAQAAELAAQGYAADADASAVAAAASAAAIAPPNPMHLAWGGQSNSLGADGGSDTNWITVADKVFVWVPTSQTWEDALGRQGLEPFNGDGSNCPAVHVALKIAQIFNIQVRIVMASQGSTEIEKWTGGGYQLGSPRVTDRTISDVNREEFKKWTDAIDDAGIDEFDAVGWWQGEADLDTPEDIYMQELLYLYDDLKARGLDVDPTRRFPMIVFPPYTGVKSGQQSRRARTIERFSRQYPQFCALVPTADLEGRDESAIINHFTSAAYKTAGERGGHILSGKWGGLGVPTDERLNDLTISAVGLQGERFGHRGWELNELVGTEGSITGATQADPVVITEVGHGRSTGDKVYLASLGGMTELNGRFLTITVIDVDTYSIDDEDGTAHTAYTSGGTATSALDLRLPKDFLGRVYDIGGKCAINLDETANAALDDSGNHLEFYNGVNSDEITLYSTDGAGTTRQIQLLGDSGTVTGDAGLLFTGVNGRARVVYEGSRWVVDYVPRIAHSEPVIEAGTSTSRRTYSPAELKVAALAAAGGLSSIRVVSTDASATLDSDDTIVLHMGTLTANRQITLVAYGDIELREGQLLRITRTGGGAFNLSARASGESVLVTLAENDWCELIYDGAEWYLAQKGSIA